MKRFIPGFFAAVLLFAGACSKDKTDSPFIGSFLGKYTESVIGGFITLDDVTATVEGKTDNKLEVKLGLNTAAVTLDAQVINDSDIFFPPQDYSGTEMSGSGTLTMDKQKLTIELEATSGPTKTVMFVGTRQ